jgi:hypothetical protein
MKRMGGAVRGLVVAGLVMFCANQAAFAQRVTGDMTNGGLYGNTTGAGYHGPGDGEMGHGRRGLFGGVANRGSSGLGTSPGAYSYSRGYASPPAMSSSAAPAPYLTNQTYEPGDGYRYPLYYNPGTVSYF